MNKKEETKIKIEKMRHSLSHLLAMAILEKFPGTKLGIGPIIENGFYYDFDFSNEKISEDDLSEIEKSIKQLIKKGLKFERKEIAYQEATKIFKEQPYKLELIEELNKEGEKIMTYQTGEFIDLCAGPHIESTKGINPSAFKLTKIAGVYWRGDEKNKQLTRVYGIAFETKEELDDYQTMLEEAIKRDHRKLGKELDLFVFSDLVGPGLPLFTTRGATIRRELENFIIKKEIKYGYQHVSTPELAKVDLYKKSGHYPYYKESMYPLMKIDDEELILRPMTCPHHFELYLSKPRSYRELPMRIAELARLYRYERSGELSGLMRVRSFCLADAHIVCQPEKAEEEINSVLDLIEEVSNTLELSKGNDYSYRLSLGDRENDKKYFKDDVAWENAENILRNVLKKRKSPFVEVKDEAAFYGPKIDIQMKNVLGKEDTAFTVQYDFVMPKKFNINYIDNNGEEKEAVIIHRSSIGAIERTIAFLIEKYAGAFPFWLSPIQVKILPVGKDHIEYSNKISALLRDNDIRVEIDDSDNTVGKKIREAEMEKVPFIIVLGDKEINSGDLAVRERGERDIVNMSIDDFIKESKNLLPDI